MNMIRLCALAASVSVSVPAIAQRGDATFRDVRDSGCPADQDGDGDMDIDDIESFVHAMILGGTSADVDGDGDMDVDDIEIFVQLFLSGGEGGDADGDRLADCVEVALGTDMYAYDTDNDGLSDGDEVLGTVTGVNLPAMGADPLRRTIFVETDWFAGTFEGSARNFRPTPAILDEIQETFANAPVWNPDGSTGVDIFLDYGQGGAFTGGNQLPGQPAYVVFSSGFNGYKADHFDPAREGYFHYCILANRYNSAGNQSSGIAEINGDDFMVTLFGYFNTYNASVIFVHELGHNLGLRHSGDGGPNYKPNYNSVMNYRFTFPGADINGDAEGDGVIDYSSGLNIDLDESALHEPFGVTGLTPIDWDKDGTIDPLFVSRNINCPEGETNPCGVRGSCGDSGCGTMRDHDDWGAINWGRLDDADGPSPVGVPGQGAISECVGLIPR